MTKPKLIVITGPTATGKTALGALLAKTLNAEVVSADSMQIYKFMNIGTAKPAESEMLGIAHHMLDIIPPWEDYSAARYTKDASKCINSIIERNKVPIVVGGTGLYIDSLISGRSFSAKGDIELRRELEQEYDHIGGEAMLHKLRSFDHIRADKLHANDKKRVVRALEAYLISGKTISQHDLETRSAAPLYDAKKFALSFSDRAELYARIDRRVDTMLENGLIDEVQGLLDMGVSPACTAMQAIGYKEIVEVLSGDCDIDSAADKIKMESRRYAKRQLTWFRKDTSIEWIMMDNERALGSDEFLAMTVADIAERL